MRGVDRLRHGEVIATVVHFHGGDSFDNVGNDVNIDALRAMPGLHHAVLVGVVRREQGPLVTAANPKRLQSVPDVLAPGARMAIRQPARARSCCAMRCLRASVRPRDLRRLEPACVTRTGFGDNPRRQSRLRHRGRGRCEIDGLDFVPLLWESFDLLMCQRSFFRPELQAPIASLGDGRFKQRAAEMTVTTPHRPAKSGSPPD